MANRSDSASSSDRYDQLDLLAEEFAQRFRRGERPSLKEYTDRYPGLADDIRALFPAMVDLEQADEMRQAPEAGEAAEASEEPPPTAPPAPAPAGPPPVPRHRAAPAGPP